MPDGTWIKGSAKVTLDDHACFAMDPGTPIQAYAEMKEIVAPGLSGRTTCGYVEVRGFPTQLTNLTIQTCR